MKNGQINRTGKPMRIEVVENVQKVNDRIAAVNRALLHEHGVRSFNLIGAPGCGKTAWLERTLASLPAGLVVGVLTGDLATTRDAERIAAHTPHVAQINTGRGCHLEAHQVQEGLSRLDLEVIDLLVIENVGNLICPVSWDLGQDATVGMFSVTEGDDKPAKHPYIVLAADLLLLNKTDLLPYVPFRPARFRADLAAIRDDVPCIEGSVATGAGFDAWLDWVTRLVVRVEDPLEEARS